MKNSFLIALVFAFFTTVAQDDPQKMINEFFTKYKNKGTNEAIDYIFSTNKWMTESTDQISNIKFKLNNTIKVLGTYYGNDLISKKTIGDHLTLYTFLVRYERQPLRFNFMFYKANDQWVIYNYSYDDSIDEELKEAAKAYRLKENLEY